MAASSVYKIYAVNIAKTGPVLVDGVMQSEVRSGVGVASVIGDTGTDPTMVFVDTLLSGASFTSHSLAKLLALNSEDMVLLGQPLTTLIKAEMFAQKMAPYLVRATGSAHLKMVASKGIILPRTLSVGIGRPATLACDVIPVYDGTNEMLIVTDAVALSGAALAAEMFFLGPMSLAGVVLDAVQSLEYTFGLKEVLLHADGDPRPTEVFIDTRSPRLTVNLLDAGALFDLGLYGEKTVDFSAGFYLRKGASGSTRVADATAEHIGFTFAAGKAVVESIGGAAQGPAPARLTFIPIYDGSNDIAVCDPACAIT